MAEHISEPLKRVMKQIKTTNRKMEMTTTELLPCPFCGDKACWASGDHGIAHPWCERCQLKRRDAKHWNKRANDRTAWRDDMENAPQDGTSIIVEGGEVFWLQDGWFSCRAQRYLQWEPKVWMPLPVVPVSGSK